MRKTNQTLLSILALFILSSISLAGCSADNVAPPDVVYTWKPPEGIDAKSPISCEENRSFFIYDKNAPLDIQEVSRSREEGVTVIDLTYASPMGGRVPTTLVVPDGAGPFAGIIYQHGMPGTRQHLIPGAVTYARMEAVVILIDAPFARPEHGEAEVITFTEQDRREQIQLIVDLRRAVDLLLSRPDVDPQRLAYVGISYGGAMGGLLAGVEDRLKGYVLQVGDGGLVTHLTGPEDTDWWQAQPVEVRRQWDAWMWPIEPIHYVACANPAALLFQNGTLDTMVPPADALRYQDAGSEPKTILWYADGHGLGVAASRDQAEWLSKIIGISSYRLIPGNVRDTLIIWFLLTAGSLNFLVWRLWRKRPAPYGTRLMWLLTIAFLGPMGLVIYWMSSRRLQEAGKSADGG
jgi:dienelactone hydrolase